MTNAEIIALAQKAGFETKRGMVWVDQWEVSRSLERFAALVAAAEREACAQVAEKMLRFYTQAVTGVPEAIRERSKA